MGWGEAAYGRFAATEIHLHEQTEGDEAWELQIESVPVTVRFPIKSPEVAQQILQFFRTNLGATCVRAATATEFQDIPAGTPSYSPVAELVISDQVSLWKDGEVPDRFTFNFNPNERHCVIVDLHESEISELIGAIEDLWQDYVAD